MYTLNKSTCIIILNKKYNHVLIGLMNNFILKMTEQAKGLDLHVLRISFFFGYEYRFKWRCFIELKSGYLS